MRHPALLLIAWGGFAFMMQWLSLAWLLALAVVNWGLAAIYAPARSRRLIWRSRWLLLSLAILFVFFTPGEYVPGTAGALGVTYDGLRRAGEHLSLLVAMLTSLALLHERIGTQGLLAGLYWLLAWHGGRERTIVRLMLVIEFVESRKDVKWRDWLVDRQAHLPDAAVVAFYSPQASLADKSLMGLMLLALVCWAVGA